MVLFLCLICGYFKSKNWNILFFYPLSGICERKYTLPKSKYLGFAQKWKSIGTEVFYIKNGKLEKL